jgi:hypothetical protein
MFLYAYLMGRYLPQIPGFTPPLHPVALQVFDTLETQRLRIELLTKLAKWIVKDEALLNELNTVIVPSIKKASKLRNTLVHANWGVASQYPNGLVLMPTFGHQMVYEEADFNEAIDRILEAHNQAGNYEIRLKKSLEENKDA